jgi:Heterokaryon incompatibility protein (HET)
VSGALPTRLIDVGVDDTKVRLCLTESLPPDLKYLTLSHCWGTGEFLFLTQLNLLKFMDHISIDALCKSFREAILITRRLGFRYIWIDSLCILQQDPADWQQEVTKMGTVYANSILNIAATDSPDGKTGCFFTRDLTKLYGSRVQACIDKSSSRTCTLDCFPEDYELKRFDSNVLQSRAWVFQERLLSPRAIFMGSSEVAWECREMVASETFPNSLQPIRTTKPSMITSWTKSTAHRISELWYDCVIEYSRRQLTFRRDRLAAISAIARQFAAKFGTTYVAGLWKEDTAYQLLWYNSGTLEGRSCDCGAPSWSWASVNTAVNQEYWIDKVAGNRLCLDIVSVVVDHAGDPFDEIAGGRLVVRSRALPCCEIRANGDSMVVHTCPMGNYTFSTQIFHPDVAMSVSDVHYFCLPVLEREENGRCEALFGLALKSNENNTYCRVGRWEFRGWRKSQSSTCHCRPCTYWHDPGKQVGIDDKGELLYEYTIV